MRGAHIRDVATLLLIMLPLITPSMHGQSEGWKEQCSEHLKADDYVSLLRVIDSLRLGHIPVDSAEIVSLHSMYSLGSFMLKRYNEAEKEAWQAFRKSNTRDAYLWIHTVISQSRERAAAHLREGLTYFPGDPIIMYELSDHFILYGEKDSARHWYEKSMLAGIPWGRYIARYDLIMSMLKGQVLDEADAQSYVQQWEANLEFVFLRTYETLPSNIRHEYLRVNKEYAHGVWRNLLMYAFSPDSAEERRFHYCTMLSEMLSLMPLVDPDTAEYGIALDMLDNTTLMYANNKQKEYYEGLVLAFINMLEVRFPTQAYKYLQAYVFYSGYLYRNMRFEEAEYVAFKGLQYADARTEAGRGVMAGLQRQAGMAIKLQNRFKEARSCLLEARDNLKFISDEDHALFALQLAMNLLDNGDNRMAADELIDILPTVESAFGKDPLYRVGTIVSMAWQLLHANEYRRSHEVLEKAYQYCVQLPSSLVRDSLVARINLLRGKVYLAISGYEQAFQYLQKAMSQYSTPRSDHDEMYLEIVADLFMAAEMTGRHVAADDLSFALLQYLDTCVAEKLPHLREHISTVATFLLARGKIILGDRLYRRLPIVSEDDMSESEAKIYEYYLQAVHMAITGRLQSAYHGFQRILDVYKYQNLHPSTTLLYTLREQTRVSRALGMDPALYIREYVRIGADLQVALDSLFLAEQWCIGALIQGDLGTAKLILQQRAMWMRDEPLPESMSSREENDLTLCALHLLARDTAKYRQILSGLRSRIGLPSRTRVLSMNSVWPLYLHCLQQEGPAAYSVTIAQNVLDTLVLMYEQSRAVMTETEANKYYFLYNRVFNHIATSAAQGITDTIVHHDLVHRDDYRRSFFESFGGDTRNAAGRDEKPSHRLRADLLRLQEEIETTASNRQLAAETRRIQMIALYDRLHDLQKQQLAIRNVEKSSSLEHNRVRILRDGEACVRIVSTSMYRLMQADSSVYLALVERPDGTIRKIIFPNGRTMDSLWYAQYASAIRNRIPDDKSYMRFWKEIDEMLGDVRVVYLLPDGVYSKMNVETFVNGRGKPLADEYDIVVLTDFWEQDFHSASSSARSATLVGYPDYSSTTNEQSVAPLYSPALVRAPEPDSAYTRGYSLKPLPGTRMEVLGIDSILQNASWNTATFVGPAATKRNLRDAPTSSILHIATHGYYSLRGQGARRSSMDFLQLSDQEVFENPLLSSGVFLAGADKVFTSPGDDTPPSTEGVLSAFEISSWDLSQTDLVVLSACETGLGYTVPGQSVYGLQRGITTAGAKQVIQSLWVVDDAVTRDLMLDMYQRIARGTPYREALQLAKRTIRIKHPDPYFWGAFIHVQ